MADVVETVAGVAEKPVEIVAKAVGGASAARSVRALPDWVWLLALGLLFYWLYRRRQRQMAAAVRPTAVGGIAAAPIAPAAAAMLPAQASSVGSAVSSPAGSTNTWRII
jgi:hypothetical protein